MSQAKAPPGSPDDPEELIEALKQIADRDVPFAERAQNYLEAIGEADD